MKQQLPYQEIFKPTLSGMTLAAMLTVVLHIYIVNTTVRQVTIENSEEISDFWLTNLIQALPYLETDNTLLKFLTFFIGSYILVWLGAALFRALDKLQVRVTKELRKK